MSASNDELKGRAKKAVGELTDNDELKREGKQDQVTGKVKRAADTAAERVGDAADAIKDAVRKR